MLFLAEALQINLGAGLAAGATIGIIFALIKIGDRLWLEPKTKKPIEITTPCRFDENKIRIDALEAKMSEIEITLNDIRTYIKGDEHFRNEVIRKLDDLNKKLFVGNGTKSMQTRIDLLEQKTKEK